MMTAIQETSHPHYIWYLQVYYWYKSTYVFYFNIELSQVTDKLYHIKFAKNDASLYCFVFCE